MNNKISQIVTGLLKPKAGEDLAAKIQQFREEIKKTAEREDGLYGKFLGLLESFRAIIPDEKQRYHAAIQALSTTSKLNKDGIVSAIGNQLVELATIEKAIMPAVPGQRNELTGWDARAKAIQSEITQLREKIAQLESEEKQIVAYIAARHQELDYVEKSMQHVFGSIGTEITAIQNKIQEFTAENTAVQPPVQPNPQPAPQPVPQAPPAEPAEGKEAAGQQAVDAPEPPAPLDPGKQKKCPMCGGIMNLHAVDDLWMCYSCAYEESGKGGSPGKSEDTRPKAAPAEEPAVRSSPSFDASVKTATAFREEATQTKPCPVCRKNMYWYPDEKAWRCLSCQYERKI